MEGKKRKSILHTHAVSKEEDGTSDFRLKRVSFNGKKFVREFQDHVWESYELSDRVDTTSSTTNKSSSLTQNPGVASVLLYTTNEYIDKSDQGILALENTACISLLESEKMHLQTYQNNVPSKEETNQIPKLVEEIETESSIKHATATEQNNRLDSTKYIFFNENSNKENIAPQAVTTVEITGKEPSDVTFKTFNETLKSKTLLSESDESFETRSFRQDLQRISDHVAPTDTTLCEATELKGEELPTSSQTIYPTVEEHQFRSIAKSPKVLVRHITTPMKLLKSVQEQNFNKKIQQQKQHHQEQEQQKQYDRKSVNDDALSDISGISRMADSFGSFQTQSSSESSPLLPPEYRAAYNKRIDLQQLSTDIESGKLKLFSKTGNFNRKITTPLNFNKTKKDAIDIELENSFFGTASKEKTFPTKGVGSKNALEATKHVIENIELEYSQITSTGITPSENLQAATYDIDIELEESFLNTVNDQDLKSKSIETNNSNVLQTTKYFCNDICLDSPVGETAPPENLQNKMLAIDIELTNTFSNKNKLHNEMVENNGKMLERRTVLFQDAIITEEVDGQKDEVVGTKSVYAIDGCEVTEPSSTSTTKQVLGKDLNIEQFSPMKRKNTIEKTIIFENLAMDNQTGEEMPNSFDKNDKNIPNTAPIRRGTIFFESEEIEEESGTVNCAPINEEKRKEVHGNAGAHQMHNDRRKTCHMNESILEETAFKIEASINNAAISKLQYIETPHLSDVVPKRKSLLKHMSIDETLDIKEQRKAELVKELGSHREAPIIDQLQRTHLVNESMLEEHVCKEDTQKNIVAAPKVQSSNTLQNSNAVPINRSLFGNVSIDETVDLVVERKKEELGVQNLTQNIGHRRETCYINESILEDTETEKDTLKQVKLSPKLQFKANILEKPIETMESHKVASKRGTLYFDKSGLLDETNNDYEDRNVLHGKEVEKLMQQLTFESKNKSDIGADTLKDVQMEIASSNLSTEKRKEPSTLQMECQLDASSLPDSNMQTLLPNEGMDISFEIQANTVKDITLDACPTFTAPISDGYEPMEIEDFSFKVPSNAVLPNIIKKTPLRNQNRLRKSVYFSESVTVCDDIMTPTVLKKAGISKCNKFAGFSPATPHRSLLEFENLENELKYNRDEELSRSESSGLVENTTDVPLFRRKSLKRDTANLTPNQSMSKKHLSSIGDRLEISAMDLNTTLNRDQNPTATKLNEEFAKSYFEESMNDAIDRTEPPSEFENITQDTDDETNTNSAESAACSSNTLSISATLPTTPSRIPVYKGTIKVIPTQRISSPNTRSLYNLDMLDTIEEVRFAKSIGSCDETRKATVFEMDDDDVPITISDVTQHYLSLKQHPTDETCTKEPSIELLVNEDNENNFKSLSESIAEGKELLKILGDPEQFEEYTLREWEECDRKETAAGNDSFETELKNLYDFKAKDAIAEIETKTQMMSREDCFEKKALVCRKCVRCQESIINETLNESLAATGASDSFAMPAIPPLSAFRLMDSLNKRRGPKIDDTIKFIEQIKLERLKGKLEAEAAKLQDSDSGDENEDDYEDYGNPFLKQYYECKKREEMMIQNLMRSTEPVYLTFVDKLENLMKQKKQGNWLFNFEYQGNRILKFRHKKFLGFLIVLQYEHRTRLGEEVSIKSIKLHETTIDNSSLRPFCHMQLYQTKLQLFSNDLQSFCDGDTPEHVIQMLEKINEICIESTKLSNDLWTSVIKNHAFLKRENNRNFICKTARRIINDAEGYYHRTDTTDFRIEVTDIRKLCYKSIIMPPLFRLIEVVAELPQGVNFLDVFLKDPVSYLHSSNNESV